MYFECVLCLLFSLLVHQLHSKGKNTIRLCTWNINGVVQNSHTLQERLGLVDTWWPKHIPLDVICLQEVFKITSNGVNNIAFVENFVREKFSLKTQVHGGEGKLESSGLLTCSSESSSLKFVRFEAFAQKRSYDVLANKGFLDCSIHNGEIHILNLHMQSIMSKRDWTMLWVTQKQQLDQVLAYASKFPKVVLCGDFNIRSDSFLGIYMLSKMSALGFKKVWVRKESPPFFYENEYLDQIWVKGCVHAKSMYALSSKALVSSDHIPVFAEIVF